MLEELWVDFMVPTKKTDSHIVLNYLLREWLIYLYFKLIKCNSEHSGTCGDFFIFHTSLQINLIGYKGNEVIFNLYNISEQRSYNLFLQVGF